jgi:predicted DNA-binding transcriptional regulator AlpA
MTNIIQLNEEDLQSALKVWLKDAIHEIKNIQESVPLPDRIDKEEVKKMTGKSDQWIYQKTMKNCSDPLPFMKFGRQLVFSRKEIQSYIDSHTMAPISPESVMSEMLQKAAKRRI